MKLVKYDAALKALAAATRVDEVRDIRDKAMAMQAYAKQAKDSELIERATDIRLRAEVRAGELLTAMAKTGQRHEGKGRKERSHGVTVTLADLGINKNQSSRWQRLAGLPNDKREVMIARRIRIVVAAAESTAAAIKVVRADHTREKKMRRRERERALAEKITALPDKKYGVVLADPEWQFETWSEEGKDRSAENHYPTSELVKIEARDVPSICADDCVLFLWVTVPMLPMGLAVMARWGFQYVTNFVWIKDRAGTGYWNRNRHELLLVGTKGNVPAPAPGEQWGSVIAAPRGKHSEKPADVHLMIDEYFPNLPKIELNARRPRKNWDAWGNEIDASTGS